MMLVYGARFLWFKAFLEKTAEGFVAGDEDGTDIGASYATGGSEEEELDHHLLPTAESDIVFLKDHQVAVSLGFMKDGTDIGASYATGDSEKEELDHHLLTTANSDNSIFERPSTGCVPRFMKDGTDIGTSYATGECEEED